MPVLVVKVFFSLQQITCTRYSLVSETLAFLVIFSDDLCMTYHWPMVDCLCFTNICFMFTVYPLSVMQRLIVTSSLKLSAAGTIPFEGDQAIYIQGWRPVRVHGSGN